jgi:radical SAM protein with 4Fe4S-binding SPASM domain
MVTTDIVSIGARAINNLGRDLNNFRALFARREPLEAGLYTYQVAAPEGYKRLHLRLDEDLSGVLFVDVTDVIHLNVTAAAMTKMALDNVPYQEAKSRLLSQYQTSDGKQISNELDSMYKMVNRLRMPEAGCPTCAIEGLERSALFSTRAMAPYKADLALTYGCNNACSHCYNEPDRFDMSSMVKEDWYQVLDRLHAVGVPHIIFTGGEATLHPDLPEIIHYADSLGMVTGLNTNGRRIAHMPYMQTLASSGLNHVQVTLGSHIAETHNAIMGADSFHQTVRGIHNALASGVFVITNTTLMQCNRANVEPLIDFLFQLGIRTFAMNGMIYSGGGFADPNAIREELMPPILIRVRDHAAEKGMRFLWYTPTEYCRMSPVELEIGAKRCNAGEYSICIEPNGDVLPCQSFYASAGNILRDPWKQIWQGELFRSFRDRELDPRWAGLPEKCWECPDLSLCGGGCRIEREARDGSRIGEVGGCSGCSSTKTDRQQVGATLNPVGYIPPPGAQNGKYRSNGIILNDLKSTTFENRSSSIVTLDVLGSTNTCSSGNCSCK